MDSVPDHPDLRPFLEWITERHAQLGGVTELRIVDRSRVVWSAFVGPGHVDEVLTALRPGAVGRSCDVGQANVYFGVNPVSPRCVIGGRRFERGHAPTRDRAIHSVSILAVSVGPRQRTQRFATEVERERALEVAVDVSSWLTEVGAMPLLADSGDAYQLLVPLVPAFDDEIGQAARDSFTLLRWLDARFSTPAARIDTSKFSPAQLLTLYGTALAKGEPALGYPRRWSSIDLCDIPRDVDLFERVGVLIGDEGDSERAPVFGAHSRRIR